MRRAPASPFASREPPSSANVQRRSPLYRAARALRARKASNPLSWPGGGSHGRRTRTCALAGKVAAGAQMAAALIPELFFRLGARTSMGGFGRTLGLMLPADGGAVDLRKLSSDETVVSIETPGWLCHEKSGVKPSGLIALFDEVSSYAGASVWDRQFRPGVSVNLSALLSNHDLSRVGPGSRLVVTSRKQRLGRTLGFIDVDVSVEEAPGRLSRLLLGRHTKFLPGTGLRPEFLTMPGPWRSALLNAAHWYMDRMPVIRDASPPCTFDDVFAGSAEQPGEYRLSAAHANPLGAFHGGAAVILACEAADRLAASHSQQGGSGQRAPCRRAQTISANLLAGIPLGRKESRVRVAAAQGPGPDAVVATISRLGVGAPTLAVECMVTYAPL